MIKKDVVKYYGFLLSAPSPYGKYYYVSEGKFKKCREKVIKLLKPGKFFISYVFEEDEKKSLSFSVEKTNVGYVLSEHYAGETIRHQCTEKQLKKLFDID